MPNQPLDINNPLYQDALALGWRYEVEITGNARKKYRWFDENNKPVCGAMRKPRYMCAECGSNKLKKVGETMQGNKYLACSECGSEKLTRMPRMLCHLRPMENGRCKLHGGKSIRGLAHYNTGDGGWSVDLPTRLKERYERIVHDPEILNLRDDILLTNVRIGDLLSRLESGESSEVWNRINNVYAAMKSAAFRQDQKKFAEQLGILGELIQKGHGDFLIWSDVLHAQSHKRKLVDTERKRLSEMQQTMTAEQAMGMLSFIVNSIKDISGEYIKDKKSQDAFMMDLSKRITEFIKRR